MESTITLPVWAAPGWLEEVRDWIDVQLRHLGLDVTDPIQQPHLRPWSTVLRIPTADGALFFKANTPLLAQEAGLTQTLARLRPDLIRHPLAADSVRGWMITADGGERLREVIRADRDLTHWERVLSRFAQLQIELAGRVPELLAIGVPDRRLTRLPELIAQVIDNTDKLRIDQPDGLTSAALQRLLDDAPALKDRCQQLDATAVPQSVHHGDLHDGNIFAGEHGYQIFDWGDANVSHPFFSLRSVFVSIEFSLQLEEGAPQFNRLRDAYLEPWTNFLPAEELRSLFDAAARISPLSSALGWDLALTAAGSAADEDYGYAVPSLLQEYLELQDNPAR